MIQPNTHNLFFSPTDGEPLGDAPEPTGPPPLLGEHALCPMLHPYKRCCNKHSLITGAGKSRFTVVPTFSCTERHAAYDYDNNLLTQRNVTVQM